MDIVILRTFLAAADCGSFGAAAQRVNASASTVTERVKQLEAHVGVQLFDRDKKGCRLTSAGRRFMTPAQSTVRAWDSARTGASLPESFTKNVSIGGQYSLWQDRLMPCLVEARLSLPHIAFKVSTGAAAQLARDLTEGRLDMAVLYNPQFQANIFAEKLFDDELILVTATGTNDWRSNFVPIEWGRGAAEEIASLLHFPPQEGLVLDLGMLSARWLIDQKMSGYIPRKIVYDHIISGELTVVEDSPAIPYPAYICWRDDMEKGLADQIVPLLQNECSRLVPAE